VCCFGDIQEHEVLAEMSAGASPELRTALESSKTLARSPDLSWITNFPVLPMLPTALPDPVLQVTREEFAVDPAIGATSGLLAVDWIGEAVRQEAPELLIVVFPGVGTNSRSGFAAMTAHHCAHHCPKWRVGVAVLQGHDGLQMHTEKIVSSAYPSSADAGRVLEFAAAAHPGIPIVPICCSVGCAHFTYWAINFPDRVKQLGVVGSVMVCHGAKSHLSANAVDASVATRAFILQEGKKNITKSPPCERFLAQSFPDFAGLRSLLEAKTLEEWDRLCLPLYGFKTRAEMLDFVNATDEKLRRLDIPTIFINADDDPVTPAGRLAECNFLKVVPNCATIRTLRGAHMAWWEGSIWDLRQDWSRELVAELVEALAQMKPASRSPDQ